jgi:hypothetical protein
VNPATVLTITALAGAVGTWRIARDHDDHDRPAQPDTRELAEHTGIIPAPTGDQP